VVGLTGIDLADHQKFTIPFLFAGLGRHDLRMCAIGGGAYSPFELRGRMIMKTIRLGAGAGYARRPESSPRSNSPSARYPILVFECLAERTIALAQQAKLKDPGGGFDPLLRQRMTAVLAICKARGIKIITNMGAANPLARRRRRARPRGHSACMAWKIAAVTGDDVLRGDPGRRLPDRGDRRRGQRSRQPHHLGQCLSRRVPFAMRWPAAPMW